MCSTISFEKKAKEAIHKYINDNENVQGEIDFLTTTLNARSDTIHNKASYKSSIKTRRAVLLVERRAFL